MPIYTDNPCDDGAVPFGLPLISSLGVNPKITKAIDAATKDWLDKHPGATTTVEDNSLTNAKFMDGSVNSRVIEDESITTDDITDLAVTTTKIADNAVTADKIASAAVDGLRTMSTTQPGVAKVGAGLAVNDGVLDLNGGNIASAVTAWLDVHPEATTTVEDGSITTAKLADGAVTDAKLAQSGGVLSKVDDLENALEHIQSDFGGDIHYTATTITNQWVKAGCLIFKAYHRYIIHAEIASSVGSAIYVRFFSSDTQIVTGTIESGNTVTSYYYIPLSDVFAEARVYSGAGGVNVALTVTDELGFFHDTEQQHKNVNGLTESAFTLDEFYDFVNGSSSNGVIISGYNYRIVSQEIIQFDYDVILHSNSMFKFGLQFFTNGMFSLDTGWIIGNYRIDAGQCFRIVIARETENNQETADIPIFAKQVYVTQAIQDRLQSTLIDETNTNNYRYALYWESGTLSGGDGKIAAAESQIRSQTVVLPAGRYYINPNGYLLYYIYYTSAGRFDHASNYDKHWGVSAPFFLELSETSYIRFVQKNENGTLSPSDATLVLEKVNDNDLYYSRFANGVKFISKGGNGLGVPRESVLSVIEAWKNLYDVYRVDVCKTSDGYYVASHDRSINSYARNSDGTAISSTINIDEHTLAELNQYDYGITSGQRYAGQKITLVSDIIAACAKLGMSVSVEWKFPSMIQTDADALFAMMASNGFGNDQWRWNLANATQLSYVTNTCEYTDVVIVVGYTDIDYTYLESAINAKRHVMAGYTTQNLSVSDIVALRKLNITQVHSIAESVTDIVSFIEAGVTYIETTIPNPRKSLIDYALNLENYD